MKSTAASSFCVFLTINSFVGNSCGGLLEEQQGHIVATVPATESPVTLPPVPIPTGLFSATTRGLIALNLQTLEATSLTNQFTLAIAVNHNLEKIYWSEFNGNSRVMRSNINGSAPEVIVPPTGGSIYALAVHEPSGNIYFSVWYSNDITVCNALGENCAVVIRSSSLANNPYSIALDFENNVMFWSNYVYELEETSLIRANLDGSNVSVISSGFSFNVAITLEQPSNDVIYWADYVENTVGTIDVDGSNKQTLIEVDGNPGASGIQVDAHNIFFGTWSGRSIQSVDKDSGTDLATIYDSPGGIHHLALFSVPP